MDAAGDGYMRACKIRVPDCVADGLTAQVRGVGKGTYLGIDGWTDLDIVRIDLSAPNMAERALSRLWRWRPDPPP